MKQRCSEYIWLSHALSPNTPAYRGGQSLVVLNEKRIKAGDTCNSSFFLMPNHLGTHVDAPFHFLEDTRTVTDYGAHEWVFTKPVILGIRTEHPAVISQDEVIFPEHSDLACDLVLIRTGFEKFRQETKYWNEQAPFHPDLALKLTETFPNLKAIGVDTISISSPSNREFGKEIHRRLLSRGIRIFEDLALADIPTTGLQTVIALPLRISGLDGAPCSIIAQVALS